MDAVTDSDREKEGAQLSVLKEIPTLNLWGPSLSQPSAEHVLLGSGLHLT